MLRLIILKALYNRKSRLLVGIIAMLLSATLVASLVNLSMGMKRQASRELEAYGANIVLLPQALSLPAGTGGLAFGEVTAATYINEENLRPLASGRIDGVINYVPYLYAVAAYQEQKVVMSGVLFPELKESASYWQLEGNWVNSDKDKDDRGAIIGRKVAERFNLRPGDEFALNYGKASQSFAVRGIADVGGSEDNQIFIDLAAAQLLSDRQGQLDLIQIRASTEARPLTEVVDNLEENLTGIEAKVISQIAGAEEKLLFKIQFLMVLITALVLLASGVAVFSTLTASVLERTKEIGLMKALGAGNRRISLIFMAEAVAIGLLGGVVGNILGIGMAQAIAKSVFDAYLTPQASAILITIGIALAVAIVAALGPLRSALSLDPIITLRGE